MIGHSRPHLNIPLPLMRRLTRHSRLRQIQVVNAAHKCSQMFNATTENCECAGNDMQWVEKLNQEWLVVTIHGWWWGLPTGNTEYTENNSIQLAQMFSQCLKVCRLTWLQTLKLCMALSVYIRGGWYHIQKGETRSSYLSTGSENNGLVLIIFKTEDRKYDND